MGTSSVGKKSDGEYVRLRQHAVCLKQLKLTTAQKQPQTVRKHRQAKLYFKKFIYKIDSKPDLAQFAYL